MSGDGTDAERLLWQHLRAHRLARSKFRRQQPIGPYIVDFACLASRLVIEVDGGQHLDNVRDARRDDWLRQQGFTVLRFWNNDVLLSIDSVLEEILRHLPLSPSPSPARGEGRLAEHRQ
jgi:very-short-patch-repair endonuclease